MSTIMYNIITFSESNPLKFIEFWKRQLKNEEKNDDIRGWYRDILKNDVNWIDFVKRAASWKKGWKKWDNKKFKSFYNWEESLEAWSNNMRGIRIMSDKNTEKFFDYLRNKGIFVNDIRMRTFIAHLANPQRYPILDSNVYRAFAHLHGLKETKKFLYTLEDYQLYRIFFESLFKTYKKKYPEMDEIDMKKDIDDALMAYGRFIKKYNKNMEVRGVV